MSHQMRQKTGRKCQPNYRRAVISAFHGVCEYCGCSTGDYPNWATVDRIIPRTKGGGYFDDNVTLACLMCNSNKSDGDFIGPVRSLSVMRAAA